MITPQVSIIIPTYAAKPRQLTWLKTAVESALNQTLCDVEIWVVDDQTPKIDGSNPVSHLVETFKHPQLHYLQTEKHYGSPAGPRNLAIRQARGEWIAFLDHDDLWHPEKLAKQMALAKSNPELKMIHSNATFQLPEDFPAHNRQSFPNLKEDLLHTYPICEGVSSIATFLNGFTILSTVCIRKDFLEQVGFLDEETSPCDDTDLFLKLGEAKAVIGFLRDPLVTYRISPESLSANRLLIHQKKIRVLEKALSRSSSPENNLLQQTLLHTLRVFAYQAFQSGRYDESLRAFDRLAQENALDLKTRIYQLSLRLGNPRWILWGRKILRFITCSPRSP